MDTSASFLDSLRLEPSEKRWHQLVEMYTPLIRNWLIRGGADPGDLDDLAQNVLMVVVRRFPEFRREPQTGAFRSWLRTIAVNRLREHWRTRKRQPVAPGGTDFGDVIESLADPQSPLSQLWNREHNEHVAAWLLMQVRSECSDTTWRAFQRFALDGLSADDVARELGITANSVFIAKSRVLAALRKIGRGLID